jgi:multidrug resistance efflux pump
MSLRLTPKSRARPTEQLRAQLQSQIEGLRARVAQSAAMSDGKKALVDRQNRMVAQDAASMDMLKPTQHQYSAALHNTDAENAKLNQKQAQLRALNDGIYVGEDMVAVNTLAQKRRDIRSGCAANGDRGKAAIRNAR